MQVKNNVHLEPVHFLADGKLRTQGKRYYIHNFFSDKVMSSKISMLIYDT